MGIFEQKPTVFVTALSVAVTFCAFAGAEEPAKVAGSPKKAVQNPTLIVFDLVPERGIDRGLSNLLTELVIDRVSRMRRYSVMGQKDLDKMLSWEQNKQFKGCTDTSCLIQIAGALGAAYYVEGSIGNIGDQYLVTLKLMDANKVAIVERATEKTKKDENVIVGTVERMVDAIFGTSPPPKDVGAAGAPDHRSGVESARATVPESARPPVSVEKTIAPAG
ncbi:MAG: hypothetical protein HY897_21105, partial [Deltaproteobacteria bacterium]|nr:hypothetical protein [Deltaproteobacteria bacterium]